MNIKCLFGHKPEVAYTYKSTHQQELWCVNCGMTFKKPLPPLIVQIEKTLKMDISREEMNRKLDNLTDSYGYRKFTLAMLELARKNFRVPNREARHETRDRLVMFYLKEYGLLTSTRKYASMALSKIIK